MLSKTQSSQAILIAQTINRHAEESIRHAIGFEHDNPQERQEVLEVIQSLTAKKYAISESYPVSDHHVTEIYCGGRANV